VFNSNDVPSLTPPSRWQVPLSVLNPRLFKLVQFDF
jgi:hypothetical protein